MPRRHDPEPRPIAQLSLDMRLTTEDLENLTPGQIAAVFESVGRLVALQHEPRRPEPPGGEVS